MNAALPPGPSKTIKECANPHRVSGGGSSFPQWGMRWAEGVRPTAPRCKPSGYKTFPYQPPPWAHPRADAPRPKSVDARARDRSPKHNKTTLAPVADSPALRLAPRLGFALAPSASPAGLIWAYAPRRLKTPKAWSPRQGRTYANTVCHALLRRAYKSKPTGKGAARGMPYAAIRARCRTSQSSASDRRTSRAARRAKIFAS